jgi:membrane associated rhomboid family serine protease
MPDVSRAATMSYQFGPGPPTPAVKLLLIITVGAYVAQLVLGVATYHALEAVTPLVVDWLGLTPMLAIRGFVWQLVTYLFLHATVMHVLFNMLALWMFGVDLERRWGRTAFLRYYFVCGVGAGLTCIAASFLPTGIVGNMYYGPPTIGASGAIYGLLLAYAMLFPTRTIYLLIFPVNVRIYVIIAGVLVLMQSFGGGGNGVAHFAHLGGLVFGYLYLSLGRGGPWAEIKYRYVKWRMTRLRKRFDVRDGGRRWDSRVH